MSSSRQRQALDLASDELATAATVSRNGLSKPIPVWRAWLLLTGLRFRRTLNTSRARWARLNKKKEKDKRSGTAKKQGGWGLPVFVGTAMVFNTVNLTGHAIENIIEGSGEHALPRTAALLVALLCLCSLLLAIGQANKDLNKLDWDMEWLMSLPASIPTLYSMKIAERTLANAFGWIVIIPVIARLLWEAGLRWSAVPTAFLICAPLFLSLATLQVVIEVGARSFFPKRLIQNTQALATIVSLVGLYLAMAPAIAEHTEGSFVWSVIEKMRAFPWLPFGQAALLCFAGASPSIWQTLLLYVAECSAYVVVGWSALRLMHRRGAVEGRGALRGQRGSRPEAGSRKPFFSGIVGKELRLLTRDRSFFTNTLVVPTLIIGIQVLINPSLFSGIAQDPKHLAAVAFGLGAYLLLGSSLQVLNSEGPAVWILFTVPKSVSRTLLSKAMIWVPFAALYTSSLLIYGFVHLGPSFDLAVAGAYAIIGLPIYALIGGALGATGSDPLAKEVVNRFRIDRVYLFMLLEGLYAYGIYAPSHWTKVVLVVLLGALALALWQNVEGSSTLIFDPVATPPPSIRLSDGLMAALFFFICRALIFLVARLALDPTPALVVAFSLAGFLVSVGALNTLRRRKLPRVWRSIGLTTGSGLLPAGLAGVIWSVPAVASAVIYLRLADYWPWLREQLDSTALVGLDLPWMVALVVLAAPIFEEIIFRGLVFQGISKTMGRIPSVLASAAIFAIVHPPASVAPVFVLGVCAAFAFARSGSLISAMVVHAIYNGVIVLLHVV